MANNYWVCLSCDQEHEKARILGFSTGSREQALRRAQRRSSTHLFTAVDVARPGAEQEIASWLTACGAPPEDAAALVAAIHSELDRLCRTLEQEQPDDA